MQCDNDTTERHAAPTESAWGPREVAQYLRISPRSVHEMVGNQPNFPPPVVLGPRTFRWHPDAVRDWFRSQHESRPPVRSARSERTIVARV
jgi:predicted DNA-binding transcriptional regulator AlpA